MSVRSAVCLVALCAGTISADPGSDLVIPPSCHVSPTNSRAPGGAGFTVVSERDGMELVFVPGGEFLYGEDCRPTEEPAFFIDRHEVTNAQFAVFVRETGYAARHWKMASGREEYPAVSVSYGDAAAYAAWAGRAIPTDGQWEKAARGTDGREYPWGNEWVDANAVTPEGGHDDAMPVGSAPGGASPYGALDMVGNVWEWTSSPDDTGWLALRGGAWDARKGKRRSNCTYRSKFPPVRSDRKLGFRCVYVLSPAANPGLDRASN